MTDVKRVDNYSFVNEEGAMVDITKKRRGRTFLTGRCIEHEKWFQGIYDFITSSVCEISEDGKVTTKHNVYELGTISPDYQEFLEATRTGVLAIGNWNIYGSRTGSYYITGDIFQQRKSIEIAKIIHQEGNFLTIRQLKEKEPKKFSWSKSERVFVCWGSISRRAVEEINKTGKVADLSYDAEFEKFNEKICRPILQI